MTGMEILVALAIAVGLVGIAVPMLPGSLLVFVAILVWATEVGGTTAWLILAVASACLLTGTVVKYLVPGRRLKASGVPTSTLLLGAVLGVIGFFVVPVVGLVLGFVLGVYLGELQRLGRAQAWPATVEALKAVGLSMLIEFSAALLAALVWFGGVLAT